LAILLWCLSLSVVRPAGAALGDAAGSAPFAGATGTRVNISTAASPITLYRWSDPSAPDSEIREFAAEGKIFAVAWRGQPTTRWHKLLGNYAPLATDAGRAQSRHHRRRSAFSVRRAELVVEQIGSPRATRGAAYLPAQVPTGFDLRSLR